MKIDITELPNMMRTLQQRQQEFFETYENGLTTLSIEIAQKVLGSLIRQQETLLLPLVEQAMSTVKNEEWITVQVSEKMPVLVDQGDDDQFLFADLFTLQNPARNLSLNKSYGHLTHLYCMHNFS